MLVLQRKLNERIRIRVPNGPVIWVSVADIQRGKVRVGVVAPENVLIHREELLEPEERYLEHFFNPPSCKGETPIGKT